MLNDEKLEIFAKTILVDIERAKLIERYYYFLLKEQERDIRDFYNGKEDVKWNLGQLLCWLE